MRALFLSAIVGVLFGVSGFTFIYAKGHSYLSSDPTACVNCHVMRSQYDGWLKSSHHAVAVCTDCHMPEGLLSKYITKAENGFLHSKAFTLQDYLDPIQIRPSSLQIANSACLKCHGEMTSELSVHRSVVAGESELCTHCHADVGH